MSKIKGGGSRPLLDNVQEKDPFYGFPYDGDSEQIRKDILKKSCSYLDIFQFGKCPNMSSFFQGVFPKDLE